MIGHDAQLDNGLPRAYEMTPASIGRTDFYLERIERLRRARTMLIKTSRGREYFFNGFRGRFHTREREKESLLPH